MNRKVSLETFISENAASSSLKKESKLMPFKTEITELKKLGYTLDQIVEYLRLNDLIAGRSTVVYFINNHIEAFNKIEILDSKNYKIFCPLSYGNFENIEIVKKYGNEKFGKNFYPLSDFINANATSLVTPILSAKYCILSAFSGRASNSDRNESENSKCCQSVPLNTLLSTNPSSINFLKLPSFISALVIVPSSSNSKVKYCDNLPFLK